MHVEPLLQHVEIVGAWLGKITYAKEKLKIGNVINKTTLTLLS